MLATPTSVSAAPATEQKQYHKNNQDGFHVVPGNKEAGLALCDGRLASSLTLMIELAKKGCLITLDHFEHLISSPHVGR
jgi:hypothetical protein